MGEKFKVTPEYLVDLGRQFGGAGGQFGSIDGIVSQQARAVDSTSVGDAALARAVDRSVAATARGVHDVAALTTALGQSLSIAHQNYVTIERRVGWRFRQSAAWPKDLYSIVMTLRKYSKDPDPDGSEPIDLQWRHRRGLIHGHGGTPHPQPGKQPEPSPGHDSPTPRPTPTQSTPTQPTPRP